MSSLLAVARRFWRWIVREWPALLVISVVSIGIFFFTYRVTPSELKYPIGYKQDAMHFHGLIKAYADRGISGLWGARIPHLGAPAQANWADWPTSEDLFFMLIGLLALVAPVTLTMNIAWIGAHLAAAWSLFAVARLMRISRPAAVITGTLFGMTPYMVARNVHHFNLSMYWPVAWGILAWVWLGQPKFSMKRKNFVATCVIGALMAISTLYYCNYFVQIVLLLGVLHAVKRRWAAVKATAVVLAVVGLTFALVHADTFMTIAREGYNKDAVNREMMDVFRFGLRPIEFFVPSLFHRVPAFVQLAHGYFAKAPLKGEFPSPFLGVFGCFSLVVMFAVGMSRVLSRERPGLAGFFVLLVMWLTFVCIGGGLMQAFQSVLNMVAFRSNNRVSIFVMGIVLLFLGRWFQAMLRKYRPAVTWSVALIVSIVGVWEQSPMFNPPGLYVPENRAAWKREVDSDEKWVAALEAAVPAESMVFIVPSVPFPEGGAAGGMADNDSFRPFLMSHTLRWSFGNVKGRPEAAWAFKVAVMPPAEMLNELRTVGFRAVTFHTRAIPRPTIDQYLQVFASTVSTKVIDSEDGDWVTVYW